MSLLKKKISDQDTEIQNLKAKLQDAEQRETHIIPSNVSNSYQTDNMEEIAELKQESSSWKKKYESLQTEMEDLLVCLAEQDIKVKSYKDILKSLGQEVSEDEYDEQEDPNQLT